MILDRLEEFDVLDDINLYLYCMDYVGGVMGSELDFFDLFDDISTGDY